MRTVEPRAILRIVIEQAKRARVGHVGSALCVAEIIAALYSHVLYVPSPDDAERDRFILSKGHAALALYAALQLRGWLTQEQLDSYCTDASLLECIRSVACLASTSQRARWGMGSRWERVRRWRRGSRISARRVFVLVSDAECNEGRCGRRQCSPPTIS